MIKSGLNSSLASAIVLAIALGSLSGCQENLHTHWASPDDSASRWSASMPGMPIDVHSRDPSAASPDAIAHIPNATTADLFAQAHSGTQQLSQQPRVVLYIGGDQLPTSESFCTAEPALQAAHGASEGVLFGGAICDGPRLVDTVQRTFKPDELAGDGLARAVDNVKSQLLFGLSVRQSKPPADSEAN